LIGLAGALKLKREVPSQPMLRAVWQAYRNGKKASWLPGEDYLQLLAEPLDQARTRLKIERPSVYLSVPAEIRAEGMAPAAA
jgi:ubiquinone biosynthesis protein COQ4